MIKPLAALLVCVVVPLWGISAEQSSAQLSSKALSSKTFFKGVEFGSKDSVLLVDQSGRTLFDWQGEKSLVPASLSKLATAYLAINKWGLDHRFTTDFYFHQDDLWVKGYGDPFIISEELETIAKALNTKRDKAPKSIRIDSSYFNVDVVPGRTKVADPYNAPLAATSANFNTAMLRRKNGSIISAEAQTPLTPTAVNVARSVGNKAERINLVSVDNAQRNFAELLGFKAGWTELAVQINQSLPENALLVYRHQSSKTLAQVLQGALEYSNNFIANQVFLKLADQQGAESVSFEQAKRVAHTALSTEFGWQEFALDEGSGLSRGNRFSARQLCDLLAELKPYKTLLKRYEIESSSAIVHAKTGTLTGVHSFAGYIEDKGQHYRFVFNFNRQVPYRYRQQMLKKLLHGLQEN